MAYSDIKIPKFGKTVIKIFEEKLQKRHEWLEQVNQGLITEVVVVSFMGADLVSMVAPRKNSKTYLFCALQYFL